MNAVAASPLTHLADAARWVAWRLDRNTKTGKLDRKVPYNPAGGTAKTDTPATWGTLAAAEAAAVTLPRACGVGVVLGIHNNYALGGLDLDTCRDSATGEVEAWAADLITRFATYAEVSPSGTGIKLFFAYEADAMPAFRKAMGTKNSKPFSRKGNGPHPPAIEIHFAGRYFTVTGNPAPGGSGTLATVPAAMLLQMIQVDGPAFAGKAASPAAAQSFSPTPAPASAPIPTGGLWDRVADLATRLPPLARLLAGDWADVKDQTGSGFAWAMGGHLAKAGFSLEDMTSALQEWPHSAAWFAERSDPRALKRIWDKKLPPVPGAEFPTLGPDAGPDAWRALLRSSDKGVPKGDLANVLIALRHAPAWSGVLAFNTFASRVEMHAPPPWHGGEWKPRAMQDTDTRHATEWMQLAGLRVDVKTVSDGLLTAADDHAFHPIRRYLNELVWDGTARLDAWLTDHLGAEDNDLNRAFASRFLIGAVARAMRPGCKLDTCLVLEGDQNLGKSSALATLCADPEWFTDHISDLGSKDARQDLQGKLILEMGELDSISRAEVGQVKAFLSTAVDHFRESYERFARDYPRCGVFAGTINPESAGYLKDNTGNRRFWTVACGVGWLPGRAVNKATLADARGQLWAEAADRFKAGQPWWLEERALQVAQAGAAELRRETDAWEEPILAFVAGKEHVGTVDILTLGVGKPLSAHTRADAMKVAGILRAASWTRHKVRVGNQTVWRFFPPTPPVRSSAVVVPIRPGDEFSRLLG